VNLANNNKNNSTGGHITKIPTASYMISLYKKEYHQNFNIVSMFPVSNKVEKKNHPTELSSENKTFRRIFFIKNHRYSYQTAACLSRIWQIIRKKTDDANRRE